MGCTYFGDFEIVLVRLKPLHPFASTLVPATPSPRMIDRARLIPTMVHRVLRNIVLGVKRGGQAEVFSPWGRLIGAQGLDFGQRDLVWYMVLDLLRG